MAKELVERKVTGTKRRILDKHILSGEEKMQLIYTNRLEEYWKSINGIIFVKGELMPDDREEAIEWINSIKHLKQ
jgi:hypothetical protein